MSNKTKQRIKALAAKSGKSYQATLQAHRRKSRHPRQEGGNGLADLFKPNEPRRRSAFTVEQLVAGLKELERLDDGTIQSGTIATEVPSLEHVNVKSSHPLSEAPEAYLHWIVNARSARLTLVLSLLACERGWDESVAGWAEAFERRNGCRIEVVQERGDEVELVVEVSRTSRKPSPPGPRRWTPADSIDHFPRAAAGASTAVEALDRIVRDLVRPPSAAATLLEWSKPRFESAFEQSAAHARALSGITGSTLQETAFEQTMKRIEALNDGIDPPVLRKLRQQDEQLVTLVERVTRRAAEDRDHVPESSSG
jgi:hypothetical protein